MVNLLVRDRKFFYKLKNGEDFLTDPGDFSSHLKGSAGEEVLARYLVDISWTGQATPSSQLHFVNGNTITRDSGSWIKDGFSLGDIIDATDFPGGIPTPKFTDRSVTIISDDELFFSGAALPDQDFDSLEVNGKTELTGFQGGFGILGNDEIFNFISKVDLSDQLYNAKGVGEDTGGGRIITFVDAESKGEVKGWQSGGFKIRYVSNPDTYVQRFEFEHEFITLPYYLEGYEGTLLSGLQPPLLLDAATLTYAIQLEFRNTFANPNTAKTDIDDGILGSVGGFGENFNGFNGRYTLESVAYEEISSGDATEGIIVSSSTRITAVINSLDDKFLTAKPFMVFHSFAPTQDEYQNQIDDYKTVWIYDNKRNLIDAGPVDGTIIKNVSASLLSVSQIQVEFDMDLTAAQQDRLDEDDKYLVWVQVADDTLTNDDSDKVSVLIDLTNYIKDPDIPGLLEWVELEHFPHAVDETGVGFTDGKGWIEDGYLTKFRFKNDRTLKSLITDVRLRIVAYNSLTGVAFDLEKIVVPLPQILLFPDGLGNSYQQINVNNTRNFPLIDGDQFKLLEFNTDNQVGNERFYNGFIAWKARWETWIALDDADTVFNDITKPNNGLNLLSSNYSLKEDYAIQVWAETDMSKNGVNTTYRHRSPDFDVREYDLDASGPPLWSLVLKTFTADGITEITPRILTDAPTLMKGIWTQASGPVVDASDLFIIHRGQKQNDLGQQIPELSSLGAGDPVDRPPPLNNLLIPVVGFAKARTKIEIVGGDVVSTCLIDNTKFSESDDLRISAKLGSITNTPPIPANGKLMEDGTPKVTEAGDNKILDP